MKLKGITGRIPSKFKSIQSSIFCAVSVLVLSAVLVVTLDVSAVYQFLHL